MGNGYKATIILKVGNKDYNKGDWSIKRLNKEFTNLTSTERYNRLITQLDEARAKKNWWLVKYVAKELCGIEGLVGKPFDIKNLNDVNCWNFTSFGITDLLDTANPNMDNVYLVVVDFHS